MEYLVGDTMRSIVRADGFVAPARTLRWMRDVLLALEAAHALRIFHRDIKPANIMIVPAREAGGKIAEQAKLCDFGLAKLADATVSDSRLTIRGEILGTPAFMAPEQLLGQEVDERTDLYACGLCLYFALSGRLPFLPGPEDPKERAIERWRTDPTPLSSIVRDLDPAIEAIVVRAMCPDRNGRFPDAHSMLRAIDEVLLKAEPISQRAARAPLEESTVDEAGTMTLASSGGPRWSTLLAAIAGAALVALIALVLLGREDEPAPVEPVTEERPVSTVTSSAQKVEAQRPALPDERLERSKQAPVRGRKPRRAFIGRDAIEDPYR
jgi:serine/threonine-protein kinase